MTQIDRATKETKIALKLSVNGSGSYQVKTGIGFFDHMIESLCKHAQMDLELVCDGDLHVDFHHTVEDAGIALGEAIKKEIYPIQKVQRFGNATVVMDEAAVTCDMDLSNRPFLVYEMGGLRGKVGEFDCELGEEFFRALCFNAGITAHIIMQRGSNAHHLIEASFKAFAVAFRRAMEPNEKAGVPSTKGVL